MTRAEKVGAVVLVALFVILCLTLVIIFSKPLGSPRRPEDSVFVKQRIINLQKSR